MNEVIKLYKNLGETPLECLGRLRRESPEYENAKMTYLGRLDPMAEGLLLVLINSVKDKEKYLGMDKTYEFEVLWGFETDTYDVLGLVKASLKSPEKLEAKMPGLLKKISEKKTQVYPPFSSKVFKGNYLTARENRISELDIAEKGVRIFDIKHLHTRQVLGKDILENISERIALVKGDFRQKEILKGWQKAIRGREEEQFLVSRFVADVSSGTYIRSLSHEMGKLIGTPTLAFGIKRTRVGDFYL